MKILMINVVCGIRSTGRMCTDLASALEKAGHEVKIAYGRESVPKEFQKYAVRIGTDVDVKLHGLKARFFDGCGFGSKHATVKFIEWVKAFNPDVIHLHNLHGYYINLEVLFSYLKTCGKRIVWTLHDCWAFTGHSAYCDVVSCEKWKDGCNNCPQKKIYPKSYIDRSSVNWERKKAIMQDIPNMQIVTPSQWLADLVGKSFLRNSTSLVINNGIDKSQFHPIESDFRQRYGIADKFIILGVSTAWSDLKGLADFIKLSELLQDTFCMVLVGVTEKQKKQVPRHIITIERTSSIRELVSIYSAADLYVNLSYCENYPSVNLEAQACGTPVITYRTGGSSESVPDSNVVNRGDLNAVVDLIESGFDSSSFNGVEHADISEMIGKYLMVYCDRYE